jgi:alanine-synthesizing transaminase
LYRYSQRLPWSVSQNAFSQLVEQKRREGAQLLDLTISNPTEAFEDYPHASIARVFGGIEDVGYRPDPFGEERARIAVADYYASRGITISPRQLLLTASTSEAYSFLFKLFCDPGDEVLAPVPSYPLFEYLAALESVRIVPYRLGYDGSWFIDKPTLEQGLSPRTRAIVIVNPNNPTGSFLKKQEARELYAIAQEHQLPLISDEVFMDYAFDAQETRLDTLIGNDSVLTFSLNGLSKAAGMPQMKLGWIAISGPPRECETARQRLELISDTFLSLATPVQRALPELFRIGTNLRHKIQARAQLNLLTLSTVLESAPAHVLHAEGGWSAVVRLPRTRTEEEWTIALLQEQSMIVQPGYFFDMEPEPHIVVSLIGPCETFAEAIQRLKQAVDQ